MRNLGLDIARSLAILLVLTDHSQHFFEKYYDVHSFSYYGFLGVEIFFVLSGFLIGKIIITTIIDNPSRKSLIRFYLRRWFRTLPLYFLALGFLSLINWSFHWENLFFIQNFNKEALGEFGVSWSLSIEEWFYLLIPFLILVTVKSRPHHKATTFFKLCGLLFLIFTIIRIGWVIELDPLFDFGVRKQIFLRMDSLIIGVILAGIKIYFKPWYEKVTNRSNLIFLISIGGLTLITNYYMIILDGGRFIDNSFFSRTLLFSCVSLCFMLLIAFFDTSTRINSLFAKNKYVVIFKFLSLTSYAVYLIHAIIFDRLEIVVNDYFENAGLAFGLWLVALILVFVLAHLIYKYFELPILKLRDKLIPEK